MEEQITGLTSQEVEQKRLPARLIKQLMINLKLIGRSFVKMFLLTSI